MDQATLVDDRIADARKLIDYLSRQGRLDVSAAYWMESLDDDDVRWYLHIISPTIDRIGLKEAYVALISTFNDHPDVPIVIEDINLKSPDNAVAAEVLDFLEHYPASEAFRLKGVYLKGHFVDRACIYPVKLAE
jgi:hypothetical protein